MREPSFFPDVVGKICLEQTRGILVVPEWPSQAWYHVLSAIALGWWEIPHDLPLFQTEGGGSTSAEEKLAYQGSGI